MLIFVYGTLMRGFSNHRLMKNCKFVGIARTVEKYGLFVADFPFVTDKVKSNHIHGELYEILDSATLENLDELEGHPDWYERKPISVNLEGGDGSVSLVSAMLYFNEHSDTNGDIEVVSSGSFRESVRGASHRSEDL